MVIGFNKKRTSAWLRCINMKNMNLMWMQSNIKGGDVTAITEKVIKKMTKKMKIPFADR